MSCVRIIGGCLLAAGLAACGSTSSMDLFNRSGTAPQTQAGEPGAQVETTEAGQAGQPQQLAGPAAGDGAATAGTSQSGPAQQQAGQQPAPAAQQTQATAQAQPPAEPDAGADGPMSGDMSEGGESLAAAARARADEQRSGYRVDSSSAGSGLQRRLDTMLGGAAAATPEVEQIVRNEEVVGNWTLEEEDGLRTCKVSLSNQSQGARAVLSQGCSEHLSAVANWGLFGADLLLRNGQNEVIARLRRSESGQTWLGFTIDSGIPLFLSKA